MKARCEATLRQLRCRLSKGHDGLHEAPNGSFVLRWETPAHV